MLARRKPRIFIGSATENLDVAHAIQANLGRSFEITVWDQGVFRPAQFQLDALLKASERADFAIFDLTDVDKLWIRGKKEGVTRDNVIFELGLFTGRLGRNRVFIVIPENRTRLRIPTDLLGVVAAEYDSGRSDGNLKAALGTACNEIMREIQEVTMGLPLNCTDTAWHTLCHYGVVHMIRELAHWISSVDHQTLLDAPVRADTNVFCSSVGKTLGKILDCPETDPPHCCLKVNDFSNKVYRIVTIGRSSPSDREPEYGRENAHVATSNSVFASILGKSDGINDWPQPFSSFSCNNLVRHRRIFACDRKNWKRLYKSTLAYPIRHRPSGAEKFTFSGFLTFDRNCIDGFPQIPCAFEHRKKWEQYETLCRESPAWHLGACIADMLYVTLLPVLHPPSK